MHLKENFTIFKNLFEESSIAVIVTNSDGVMEWVNSFAAEMFEYHISELLGKKVEIFLPDNLKDLHIKQRQKYAENPTPRAMGAALDLEALTKNNTKIPIELSLSHYTANNKLHIVSIINNISERVFLKNKLKQDNLGLELKVNERTQELTQALIELNYTNENLQKEIDLRKKHELKVREALVQQKELNDLKSRFVSMASHEFRTPLGGILTSASLLSKYNSQDTEDKREKHIKTIKKSVSFLTTILNDFLSLDRLDQGAVAARPSSFLIVDFVKNTINDVKKMVEENYNFQYKHIGEDLTLHQDNEMLRNILVNLLSNAMKYSTPCDAIYITTEKINDALRLTIRDEGIGIPEEDQKHLFEKFFRAHNATTIQGTGLGLNIVKKYLEYMNGSIDFESQENIGTSFTITIPMEIKNEKNSAD